MTKCVNKKGQLCTMLFHLSFIILFVFVLLVNWNQQMWEDIQFKVRDGSVVEDLLKPVFASLEHAFSSKTNVIFLVLLPIVLSLVLVILIFIFCNKKNISKYNAFLSNTFTWPLLASIGIYISLFYVDNSLMVMLYNIFFGLFFISLAPFILAMVKTCHNCGYFNTKKCISASSTESYYPKHVEGGYRTIKADVKDSSGNIVGTVEAKKYEEGYTYAATSTSTIKRYRCSNCGNITEVEHTTD